MFGLAFHQPVWILSYRGEREAAPVYRALQDLHGLHLMLSVVERRPKSMTSLRLIYEAPSPAQKSGLSATGIL